MTLCHVFRRFYFGVLTFYFRILSFLFMCSVYGVVHFKRHHHEVGTRYRRKDGQKRSCKYFNAFIVHVVLVGYLSFEIHAAGNYPKSKIYRLCYKLGFPSL